MNLKDQRIVRHRTLRMIPIFTQESRNLLVEKLAFDISVDGHDVRSAPLKAGETIDLLGISWSSDLASAGAVDQTDVLAHKAVLEGIILQVGDQYVAANFSQSFVRGGNYRELSLRADLTVNLHKRTMDLGGRIINLIDAYTTAGIQIEVDIGVFAVINRATGAASLDPVIRKVALVFPDPKTVPSLQDEEIRASITRDVQELFGKKFDVAGYLLDIDRVNHFEIEPYVPAPSEADLRESAATSLVTRYTKQG